MNNDNLSIIPAPVQINSLTGEFMITSGTMSALSSLGSCCTTDAIEMP